MDLIAALLLAHRAAFQHSTLFAKWKRDNPGECRRVEAYWDGGPRPQPKTAFGAAYALAGEAYVTASQRLPEPLGDPRG